MRVYTIYKCFIRKYVCIGREWEAYVAWHKKSYSLKKKKKKNTRAYLISVLPIFRCLVLAMMLMNRWLFGSPPHSLKLDYLLYSLSVCQLEGEAQEENKTREKDDHEKQKDRKEEREIESWYDQVGSLCGGDDEHDGIALLECCLSLLLLFNFLEAK